jgi:hypothetical protein
MVIISVKATPNKASNEVSMDMKIEIISLNPKKC